MGGCGAEYDPYNCGLAARRGPLRDSHWHRRSWHDFLRPSRLSSVDETSPSVNSPASSRETLFVDGVPEARSTEWYCSKWIVFISSLNSTSRALSEASIFVFSLMVKRDRFAKVLDEEVLSIN